METLEEALSELLERHADDHIDTVIDVLERALVDLREIQAENMKIDRPPA